MAIRLSAPIQIENLLPYDIDFRIVDKTNKQDWSGNFLCKGLETSFHLIELGNLLLLSITVRDTGTKLILLFLIFTFYIFTQSLPLTTF